MSPKIFPFSSSLYRSLISNFVIWSTKSDTKKKAQWIQTSATYNFSWTSKSIWMVCRGRMMSFGCFWNCSLRSLTTTKSSKNIFCVDPCVWMSCFAHFYLEIVYLSPSNATSPETSRGAFWISHARCRSRKNIASISSSCAASRDELSNSAFYFCLFLVSPSRMNSAECWSLHHKSCNFSSFLLLEKDPPQKSLKMADLPLGDDKVDPELQEFLLLEKQKAQVNAQVSWIGISRNFHWLQIFYSDSWIQRDLLG